MPRRPRSFFEGLYHLAPHASDTRDLFLSDAERETFLERLAHTLERFELRLTAYTLMGTHYHLVLFTPDGRVSTMRTSSPSAATSPTTRSLPV